MAYEDNDEEVIARAEEESAPPQGITPWQPPAEQQRAVAVEEPAPPQGVTPWQPSAQEDTAIPEAARYTAGVPPWTPPKQAQPPAGITPWSPPTAEAAERQPPAGIKPWQPPQEQRPEAEGAIGTAAREAAGATPATLGGLAAGATSAGFGRVAGAALGRVIGGVAGTWGGPVGSVAGWLGGGIAGGYIGEELANGIKKFLGFDDDAQRAANREANPMAAAAGQVAPLVLGLSPGRGIQAGARLLSGAIGGVTEGGAQLATGDYSKEQLAANIIGGILLPGNKRWLSNIEERAAARAGGTRPAATVGQPAAVEQPAAARTTAAGEQYEPSAYQPQQYEPSTYQPRETPGAAPAKPSTAGGEQYEPSSAYQPQQYEPSVYQPHGTPGSKGPAGTAEAQTPPLETTEAKTHGPEDWGKKPAPAEGAATGVNVTGVDPTLAHAIQAKAPAQQAGVMKDLGPRVQAIIDGPAAEAAGKFREIGEAYRQVGQNGQAAKYDIVAKELDRQHAIDAQMREQGVQPRRPGEPLQTATPADIDARMRAAGVEPGAARPAAATVRPAEVLRGPEPAAPAPTVGDQLKAKQAERAATEKIAPVATDKLPTRSVGDLHIEPNPAGGHVLMRGNEVISQHPTIGPAMIAMNRAAREAGVPSRQAMARIPETPKPQELVRRDVAERGRGGRPIKTEPLPIGTEQAILERGAEKATGPRLPPEQMPPERQALGRQQQQQQPPRSSIPLAAAPRRFEGVRAAGEKILRRWRETFQPETVSPGAQRAEPLFRKMKSGLSNERDIAFQETKEGNKRWNNIPEAERYKFWSDVENSRAVDPKFAADKPDLRRMLDETRDLEKDAGLKTAYRKDYLPHEFELRPGQQPLVDHFTQTLGPNWFLKGRTIDLVEQAVAAGYKLKNSNPYAAVRSRMLAGADLRMQKQLLDELRTMGMAGHSEEGTNARLRRMGYQAINGPDGKQWMLSPEIQPLWKNAISGKGMWSDPNLTGDVFRAWMQFKAFTVPIKLSLSGFHALHVAHINFSSNIARALDQAIAGDVNGAIKSMMQSFSTTFRPKATVGGKDVRAHDIQEQWNWKEKDRSPDVSMAIGYLKEAGLVPHMSEQLRSDALTKLDEAWKAKNPFGLAYHGPRELVRRISAPMFETWIPKIKIAAALNDISAVLARSPELHTNASDRRLALSAIGKSIDNRFGEMFYDGLFWNKMVKDTGIGSMLSLGWNLGFAREFGGAAIEAVTRPAGKFIPGMAPSAERQIIRDATNKIKFASVYMGTAMMIGGVMTKIFTGENPDSMNDYIFPRVGGTNPDGSPRRLTTMFYTREIPMLGKHIEEHGGGIGGTLAGATAMLWNKTMFQPFLELYQNRSYFGSEIWNPHSPGYEQLMQAGKHFFGTQFSPMTITGSQRIEETGGQPFEKALAFAGFGPAPAYADRSAIQNHITHLFQQHVAPADRPYKDPDVETEQRVARNKVLIATQRGDQPARQEAIREAIKVGLKPEQLGKLGRVYSDQTMFNRLKSPDQIAILERATPEERQRYWQHASAKTRVQWIKDHPVRTQ